SNIDKRALREAAERAGQNDWEYVYTSDLSAPGRGYITVGGAEAIYCLNKAAGGVKQSENVLRYIAAASPETMLALLNEIAELEQRHCGTALLEREEMHTKTLGRMLDELDAKDRRIAELELKLEAAEMRIAELGELLKKSDVEKKQPQNTLSDRPVYLGDGSDAKEKVIAGKRDIHRYESFITDRAGKGD
ncbi:TPA: ead/Ea22-like family protein, partial [Enterobacter kobei]